MRLGRSAGGPGGDPAEFQNAVAHIAVLGQMGRSSVHATCGNHLVGASALEEANIEFPAEIARATGVGVEADGDGWIDVFHERAFLRWSEYGLARVVQRKMEIKKNQVFRAAPVLLHPTGRRKAGAVDNSRLPLKRLTTLS